jgi:hypothetical protein
MRPFYRALGIQAGRFSPDFLQSSVLSNLKNPGLKHPA